MYKLLDKIGTHWRRMIQKSNWYLLLITGEAALCAIAFIALSQIVATLLVKTTYFSQFSTIDITASIFSIIFILLFALVLVQFYHETKEYEKSKEHLANRNISDYAKKHQKYVDIVEELLHSSNNYSAVCLEDDWVKNFDANLSGMAWQCYSCKHNFTDFEVAACLMYALTKKPSADERNLNLQFAFDCAKLIIATPVLYDCRYLSGGELALEKATSLKEISIPDLDDAFNTSILQILEVYISQRNAFSQVLKLADFLHIFYLYCEK